MAQLVLGTVGAVIGGIVGGPMGASAGWAIGSAVGGMLGPTQKSSGPRLDDLKVTASAYGTGVPHIFGHPRVSGTIIWASEKREIATTERQGKGGGGAEYTSYTYEIDLLILLSANEIAGVRRIWSNGKLVWSAADASDEETIEASEDTTTWKAMRVYSGAEDQLPDPTYEAAVGIQNATAYRGRGTIMLEAVSLGNSGQLPNFTFEIGTGFAEPDFFLNIPFDEDGRDIEPNPVSYTEISSGGSVYYNDGHATFSFPEAPGNAALGVGLLYEGLKFSEISTDREYTLEARFSILGYHKQQSPAQLDTHRLFSVIGSTFAVSIGVIGEGAEAKLTTTASDSVGATTQTHGPIASSIFRVVMNDKGERGVVAMYNGEILLRSVSYNEVDLDLQRFSIGAPSVLGLPAPSTIEVQSIEGYYGSKLATRTTADPVRLDRVVAELCQRCGVDAGMRDETELSTQWVHAMAVQPTAARAVLEQLATAYYFECVESDRLYFRRRGRAPVATIPYGDYGADGLLMLQDSNDLELPAQVNVTYLNLSNAYQQGNEVSDRITTDSTAVSSVQLGLGLTPAAAKAIADTAVLDQTIAARVASAALDMRYAALEPTDVVMLHDNGGLLHRARIVKVADSDGVRSLELVGDDARVLRDLGLTGENYDPDYTVSKTAETDLVPLDIPILRDQDNNPGLYVAGDGKKGLWPGYLLRVDGADAGSASTGAAMGVVGDLLGDWSSELVDESHAITVTLNPGDQLASITHDALTSGIDNYAAIGQHGRWEIVQFRSAALVSPAVYRVSGMRRGLLGTEWARGTHVQGDRFVQLDGNGLLRWIGDAASRGRERLFEGITKGARVDSATQVTLAPDWEGLKPYAPVHVRMLDTPAGRLLTWDRRSRLLTNWLRGDVPLGESSERYEIDIESSSGGVTTFSTSERQLLLTGSGDFSGQGNITTSPNSFYQEARTVGTSLVAIETSEAGGGGNSRILRLDPVTLARGDLAFSGTYTSAWLQIGSEFFTVDIGAGIAELGRVRKYDSTLTLLDSVELPAPGDGYDMIEAGGLLWVAMPYTGVVRAINPATLATVVDVPAGFVSALCTDGTSVYATVRTAEVAKKIDVATRAVVAEWPIARFPIDCKFAAGLLWVVSVYDANLTCYDPASGVRQPFTVSLLAETFQTYFNYLHQSGDFLAAGQHALYVVHAPSRTVVSSLRPFVDAASLPGVSMLSPDLFLTTESSGAASYWSRSSLADLVRARVYQISQTVGRGRPGEIEA